MRQCVSRWAGSNSGSRAAPRLLEFGQHALGRFHALLIAEELAVLPDASLVGRPPHRAHFVPALGPGSLGVDFLGAPAVLGVAVLLAIPL